jgi:hypothetical protein
MSLIIGFNDDPNLTLYCILFEGYNQIALSSGVETFTSFSPSVYEEYCFLMPPVPNRPNLYRSIDFSTIPTVTATPRFLHVEIYQMVGSTFDYNADILKGVEEFIYNADEKLNDYRIPKLTDGTYIGSFNPFNNIKITKEFYNEYGILSNIAPNGLHYQVLNPSGLSVATGSWSFVNTNYPYYQCSFSVSGNGFGLGNYQIISSGLYSNNLVRSVDYFTVSTGNIGGGLDIDVVAKFGYATGRVNDTSPLNNSFITTLPSSQDNFYNGQILFFTESPNSGQGRIISSYNGTTKRVTVNKPFSFVPANNAKISVFPIGGELNVT